jgi:hypothetical protein
MIRRQRRADATRLLSSLLIAVCVGVSSVQAQSTSERFIGRPLEDVLRVLQTRGLRLIFSSELVTPDMRVRSEPRAGTAKERLAELLQPHGLAAESGPGGIIQIVRQKNAVERPRGSASRAQPKKTDGGELDVSPAGAIYRELVTVIAGEDERDGVSAGIDRQLAHDELNGLSSHIADDPLRVVQALPGVTTGDDFRSEYSVRGSEYRQAGVIIDGVIAPWLQHAALGRGDTGTITMLRGDVVQDATLHVGAYPRVDSSQLGPQLNLTLREGSRTHRQFKLGVSGTNATVTAEGPLGSSARGSWLVGVRKSHSEWPLGRNDESSTVFGFGDLQSKVVYDVRPGQRVSLSIVAGVSNIEREDPGPFAPADGLNRAAMIAAAWRSVIRSRAVVTQRVSSLAHDFSNRNQTPQGASRGTNGAGMYRADLSQPLFRGVLEAGGQIRSVRGSRHGPTVLGRIGESMQPTVDDIELSWIERAGYASFRRGIGSNVNLAAGLRLSDSTLAERHTVDRWLQAEWSIRSRWLVHASIGVMHQFPALEQIAGWAEPASLRPEQATYVDLGIGHRLSRSVRWDATVFARRERDALRAPDLHPRLIDGVLDSESNATRFENALTGSARGIELTLARRSQTGLDGWISYSYGVARHADRTRHEVFQSDFDQRHAINVSGIARLPWKARLGTTFRGGTNVPIPGYFMTRNGALFAGNERNQERLPAYARLDVRAERTFDRGGRRFIAFAEALNVLNRVNLGPADGVILRDTGQAVGFTERLFPRLLTAGLRFEF